MSVFSMMCCTVQLIASCLLLISDISVSGNYTSRNVKGTLPADLKQISWSHMLSKGYLKVPEGAAPHIHKRFIILGGGSNDYRYQKCMSPRGSTGRCKHLRNCILDDFRDSFPKFLDYLCIIDHKYVGVCCPGRSLLSGGIYDPVFPTKAPPNVNGNDKTEVHKPAAVTPTTTSQLPHARGCGVNILDESRIVGGKPSDIMEWPWTVALIRHGEEQFCGGVLITDRHVLTAAHCVEKYSESDLMVRLGEYDLSRDDESDAVNINIEGIIIHKDYDGSTYENDIAVLKMKSPTTFNSYIWPVCLPPPEEHYYEKTAVVTGWGALYYSGPTSIVLMEVAVPVWNHSYCTTRFTSTVYDTNICAGAYEGGKDSCQGDSGGPLMYRLDNGRWITIGVVSWGIGCGEPNRPGIYTRVNKYLDWIQENCSFE